MALHVGGYNGSVFLHPKATRKNWAGYWMVEESKHWQINIQWKLKIVKKYIESVVACIFIGIQW